mmetsp:Transcript_15932/g.28312  ORF Transcript_15932/g.28312 Transcript_15932/m.28312 type:complete len:89 (+) Transcript_15932:330-596(+)
MPDESADSCLLTARTFRPLTSPRDLPHCLSAHLRSEQHSISTVTPRASLRLLLLCLASMMQLHQHGRICWLSAAAAGSLPPQGLTAMP